MRSQVQDEPGTWPLSALTLFCYSALLAATFALGYSLVALAINAASQQLGAIHSLHGM
ncbi:MAG TPA: hypothetical protein VJ715_05525 [Pyrinomonadaceae bacterium]|nr:hypothetical protein [Pyrinomonadaceae bacterium]